LLRFLRGEGLIRAGLDGAVWPSKHATVPRHVPAEQLENMPALCPSGGSGAMRNRAMLLLYARLGLRPSEVLRLRLQDLDWTTGSVLIRAGKTRRERVLPLPEDAGATLASIRAHCTILPHRRRQPEVAWRTSGPVITFGCAVPYAYPTLKKCHEGDTMP
jgi:integrase